MLRPTPGELLAGVRATLADQVLPELPPGAAVRQLRAALHALGRVESSWDLLPSYLSEENADLRASLAALARRSGIVFAPSGSADEVAVPGVTDPALTALMAENVRLQSDLDAFQRVWRSGGHHDPAIEQFLLDVHIRMAVRARRAGGLGDDDS